MKLIFCPIDIDLSKFVFKQSSESEKNIFFNPWWDSTFIKEDTVIRNGFDKILNQLPYTKITRLFYKTQKIQVESHLDVMPQMIMEEGEYDHIKSNEPCGYRIVINGGVDKLRILKKGEWVSADIPCTPCCYVINSTEAYHSVDYDNLRETIYIRGFVEEKKHQMLLEKSLLKYKKYAIYE